MPGAQRYQQRRTTGRKREILEAALACFAEQGLAATSIEHVRIRSAASTGSIYHHFRDKDGLAAAVYRHVLADYHADLLSKLDTLRTGRELIEGIVEHLVTWVSSHREAARFLVEMRHADAVRGFDDGIRKDTVDLFTAVGTRLQRHAAAGEIHALPTRLYVAILAGPAMAAIGRWVRDGMTADLDADAKALAQAAWRALRAEHLQEAPR